MTAIHWLSAINGSFTNPSDWTGGIVPGASDDAILDAVGSAFTVTSGANETVNSVQLAADATLSLTGKTFKATAGTGKGANAGIIMIGAGATFVTNGTVKNTGTIEIYGGAEGFGGEVLSDGRTTLTGGGNISLTGQSAVVGTTRGANILDNVDNTISGSGQFSKHLQLINEQHGVIDADGSSPLVIFGDCSNAGLLEASGGGELVLSGEFSGNTATGVVLAADGSVVEIARSTRLKGGTLLSLGSGEFLVKDAYLGSDTGNDLIIDAHLDVLSGCEIVDTIENNGIISLSKKGGLAVVGNVTLQGTGVIELGGGSIGHSNSSLTLASGTMEGAGFIGSNMPSGFQLTIGTAGLIDDDAKASLIIDTFGLITNAGAIVSGSAGGVFIEDSIANTGTLSVQGRGMMRVQGAVTGAGRAVIGGGTLSFISSFDEAVTFTGSGTLKLALSQGFDNSVTGFSGKGKTTLDLGDIGFVDAGEATFSGTASGGVLTVTDGANTASITLKGDYLGTTFVAASDGAGGVDVVATNGQTPSAAHFVNAMAAMSGHGVAAGLIDARAVNDGRQMLLAAPRFAIA